MEYGIFARTFLFPSGEGIRATAGMRGERKALMAASHLCLKRR